MVVVSRTGGEGFDIPAKHTGPDEYNAQYGGLAQFYDFTTQAEDLDASKSYLELSNREIAMVDRVCKGVQECYRCGQLLQCYGAWLAGSV